MIKKISIQLFAASMVALVGPVWCQTTNYSGKKIEIYTTARDTSLRLDHVGTV